MHEYDIIYYIVDNDDMVKSMHSLVCGIVLAR